MSEVISPAPADAGLDPVPHPLDPVLLRNMPFDDFLAARLVAITRDQALASGAWYGFIDAHMGAGLRPEQIVPDTEPLFAEALHRLVARYVSLDVNGQPHALIDNRPEAATTVAERIRMYYSLLPARRPKPADAAQEKLRTSYDATLILPAHYRHRETFLEIGVVCGIRRACFEADRQNGARDHLYAVRATHAILTAQAGALFLRKPAEIPTKTAL
ncbi:MAG TPA: hypothetical protein VLF69_05455 [Candidatus Saccharimonadales bacterium]|nr:hypothetical protein [Candidatus Saccharimonadales bacterium]